MLQAGRHTAGGTRKAASVPGNHEHGPICGPTAVPSLAEGSGVDVLANNARIKLALEQDPFEHPPASQRASLGAPKGEAGSAQQKQTG
jgi:hypothetical protein